jgi:hypothetical protein
MPGDQGRQPYPPTQVNAETGRSSCMAAMQPRRHASENQAKKGLDEIVGYLTSGPSSCCGLDASYADDWSPISARCRVPTSGGSASAETLLEEHHVDDLGL